MEIASPARREISGGGYQTLGSSSTSVDMRRVKTVALRKERQFLHGRKLIILKNNHVGDSQKPVTPDPEHPGFHRYSTHGRHRHTYTQ